MFIGVNMDILETMIHRHNREPHHSKYINAEIEAIEWAVKKLESVTSLEKQIILLQNDVDLLEGEVEEL